MHTCHVNSQVIRFILSVSPGKEPAAELVTENIEHQDLLFLPVDKGTRKGYNPGHNNGPSNLLERVQAFMRWTTASCTERAIRLARLAQFLCVPNMVVLLVLLLRLLAVGGWVGSLIFSHSSVRSVMCVYIYDADVRGANIPMVHFLSIQQAKVSSLSSNLTMTATLQLYVVASLWTLSCL